MLFRRIAGRSIKDPNSSDSKRLFFTLTPEQRLAIRQKLLQSLNSESTANVRNKIGDAVAAIAEQYTENGMLIFLADSDLAMRKPMSSNSTRI